MKSIAIPIPACMEHLRLDARGYPIPFNVTIKPDGTPDFRVVDLVKWAKCVNEGLCALTGWQLGYAKAFIGGPRSIASRCFTDSAMLPEAARYAIQVCPFLAAPNFRYAEKIEVAGHVVSKNENVSPDRPSVFGLGITHGYDVVQLGEDLVIRAKGFYHVEWWKNGVQVEGENS